MSSLFYKRMRPYALPLPPNKRAKLISFRRPRGYKQSQAWQDFRAMKYIASRPLGPNIRTGGYLGKELKFVDFDYPVTPIPTVWGIQVPATGALNAIAMGDGPSERIGRKTSNVSLHIRGTIRTNPPLSSSRKVRIVIYKDTQANAALATAASIMTAGVDGFRNLENNSRFKILSDRTMMLHPSIAYDGSTVTSNGVDKPFFFNARCPGETLYSGPTADINTITDNSFGVVCIADATGVQLQYTSRFRFSG